MLFLSSSIKHYTIDAFFEVNIRNSDVHFRGLSNPDVNQKIMHKLFCNITLFLFS